MSKPTKVPFDWWEFTAVVVVGLLLAFLLTEVFTKVHDLYTEWRGK